MSGKFCPIVLGTLHYVLDDGREDNQFVDFEPLTLSVGFNDYRQADTFELSFDAKAFPYSPEVVRTATVELYVCQTKSLDRRDKSTFMTPENLTFTGIVQEIELESTSQSGRRLRMTGFDYTALMSARAFDPKDVAKAGQQLVSYVQNLVDHAAHVNEVGGKSIRSRVLTVRAVGFDEDERPLDNDSVKNPTGKQKKPQKKRSATRTKTLKTVGHGMQHALRKNGLSVGGKGSTYWDVITNVCRQQGLVVFVRANEVIISTPQNLTYDTRWRQRRLVYGKNLKSLKINRKLGTQSVPQVTVRSYDPIGMKKVEATWPQDPATLSSGISAEQDAAERPMSVGGFQVLWGQFKTYVVDGVTDPDTLLRIAKMHYAHLGRHEALLSFETLDLTDAEGSDMLLLRPSDPVVVDFSELRLEVTFPRPTWRLVSGDWGWWPTSLPPSPTPTTGGRQERRAACTPRP